MKGSLIIVSFFIVGTLCGFFHLIPYDFTDSKLSYYALCGLMFCVGTSIGNDPNTLKSFRSLNPRLMFLPIMTILGTLAGCAVAGFFMSRLLFAFQYIHHRIQRTGIGDYCIALQYHA